MGTIGAPRSTPRLTPPAPGPRQAFRNEDVAKASSVTNENPELPAVPVLISSGPCLKFERPMVDQIDQTLGGFVSERELSVGT